MALLKAFVLQVVLFGLYKLFLEQVVEQHLVPDELKRNILVGLIGLLCFGIQLYTDVEEQTGQGNSSKSKNRRKTSADTADGVSEFMDYRTADMMRRLDAAMQQMNQMPTSDGYVQTVMFASAGPEATVVEQTFVRQADVVRSERVEEVHDVTNTSEKSVSEPIIIPVKVEEVSVYEKEEEVEEEESETKSDICEEEEEDVVTVIDASKPEVEKAKPKASESEEEEEEEDEDEDEEEEVDEKPVALNNKKNNEMKEMTAKKPSKQEEEEEEDEEEEESEEEEDEVKQDAEKVTRKS